MRSTTRRIHDKLHSILLFAVIYAITSVISTLAFDSDAYSITPIWPPAGVGIAALLWIGLDAWPAIALGSLLGQLLLIPLSDDPTHLGFITFTVIGNTAGPLVAVALTSAWSPHKLLHGSARATMAYTIATLILAAVSTLFGTTGLLLAGFIDATQQLTVALDWFVGDMFGVAICGPAMLAICERADGVDGAEERRISQRRFVEKLVWLAILVLALWMWLGNSVVSGTYRLALLAIPAAFLSYSALRFDALFSTLTAAILSIGLLVAMHHLALLPAPIAAGDRTALIILVLLFSGFPVLVASVVRRLRETTAALHHQSHHDHLTGIGNRRFFEKELNERLTRDLRGVAVGVIDIDNFRLANDRGGQACGDAFLSQVATHLQETKRSEEAIFRLGGDEFAVLLDPSEFAERVESLRRSAASLRLPWGDQLIALRASAGAAVAPARSTTREALQAASIACNEAKERGGDRSFAGDYSVIQGLPQRKAVAWASRITDALENDRYCLHAQLIQPMTPERRARLEVLVRMKGAEGGLIAPGKFIPVAERFRLIQRIDRWVAEAAIRWLAEHLEEVDWLDCICINVSGPTLSDGPFEDELIEMIERYAVPADRLSFEITERVAISDLSAARHFVDRFRELGCRFALDDFGAGVSSFSYLKALRIDTIKIDGSFIEGMLHDRVDRATVESICNIASLLGLVTVAEYVSSPEILDAITECKIEYAQGHAIGRAVDLESFSGVARDKVVPIR